MPESLTSAAGVVALVAAGVALVCLALAVTLAVRLRRLRAAQRTVLGEDGERDLVEHARVLQERFDDLRAFVEEILGQLDQRMATGEGHLARCLSHSAVVRYDAYGEMSGRQSSSVALLDDMGSGVVFSSILHRDQARVYVKSMNGGRSELELSPEENEAVQTALAGSASTENAARENARGRSSGL